MPKQDPNQIQVDGAKNRRQWFIWPDQLPNGKFSGFKNRDNASQLLGSFVVGQNVKFSGNSLPAIRDGFTVLGTEASNTTPVQRAWVFKNRDGDIFEIKAYSTFLYFWMTGVSTEWQLLDDGFTSGLEFGYGNIGETGGDFHTFFCNGTDAWKQWNGANAVISSVAANTLTKTGAGTWTAANFYSTGTRAVMINGVEYDYTGGDGTTTLTGVTPDPNGVVTAGMVAVQAPRAVSFTSAPAVSQVIAAHDGRLHARSDTKKTVWNYSKLDNPDDFTTGANDGDAGTKDVEFGDSITTFGKLNKAILCFKKNIIKSLEFVQGNSRIDVPFYRTIVPADDKSTTIGATNQRSTFATPYGMVFVTQDKQLLLLTGVTGNNEPQYIVLSEPIQPLFDNGVHTDATGICVDNILWYSFKSSIDATYNDTVIRGDMTQQTASKDGKVIPILWDAPYVGWNVKDWTAVYNSSTGKNEVHFHSSTNSNSYKITPTSKTDNPSEGNDGSFTSIIRSWAETFGVPHKQKRVSAGFIEIKMAENAEILSTLLFDEDGVTAQQERVLDADSADHKFTKTAYNPFGASPFGTVQFGSNPSIDDLPVYRFDLEILPNTYFFNISLQLSTSGAAQNFEVVRFGLELAEIVQSNSPQFLI